MFIDEKSIKTFEFEMPQQIFICLLNTVIPREVETFFLKEKTQQACKGIFVEDHQCRRKQVLTIVYFLYELGIMQVNLHTQNNVMTVS